MKDLVTAQLRFVEESFMMPKMSAHIGQAVALVPPQAPSTNGSACYKPLSSVWEGSDGELIEAMLNFYSTIAPTPILDATYNAGRFWKNSKRKVVSMDIDPQYDPDIVGDNREMKGEFDPTGSELLFMIRLM